MTWSIIVREPSSGALGAAVASRFFAVGAMCIHVEGGVAALATQALVNPMYAFHAMPRLRTGEPAGAVLASLTTPDPGAGQRQFHIIDAAGRFAQHTGAECVTWAGHVRGQDVSVAGNMLAGEQVTGVFLGLTYLIMPTVFMALHVFVSFMQAYIFTLLSMIYVSFATAHEH